jgi:MSHA biogenesis protein MshN
MNRYTDIGDVIVTSTVTGKAKVRMVQRRAMRNVLLALIVILLLGLAVAAWLGRGKQKQSAAESASETQIVNPAAGKPVAGPHAAPAEKSAQAQPEQALVAKPEASKPLAGENSQASSLSPQQQARNDFHKAQQLAQQGKSNEAIESYRSSLLLDAGNDTVRQAMVDLLLKVKRNADAERALQIGLKNNPKQSSYSLQLARLLADRNELPLALEVMQRTLPYASGQADYQAFYASLLQRQNQHDEAISYYQKALALKPGSGEWLMGMGISLKAAGRADEANDAFKHALETNTLSAQSRAFVEQQITQPAANPK